MKQLCAIVQKMTSFADFQKRANMNITQESIDDLNAKLKVEVSAKDYEAKVHEVIVNYRKTASIPGFVRAKCNGTG